MKRFFLLILIVLSFLMSVMAQDSVGERVKMSGQAMLMSSTNSNLTGGYYSLSPAVRGQVTASYRGFAATAMRNSDLQNQASLANLNVLILSHTRTFGRYVMTLSAETYLFDHYHNLDLFSPGLLLARKGAIDVEILALYGACFEGGEVFSQRLAISKEYAGYTFKITGWNVNWVTHRMAIAAEISTKLSDRFRLSVIGNINHIYDDDTTQKFGVVRVGYSF